MSQLRLTGVLLCALSAVAAAQNQERENSTPKTSASAPRPADRVDINHASLTELLTVPGLTESWAGRVLRYRPYRTKQDLLEKGIVSSQVYDRIKDFVIAHRDPE